MGHSYCHALANAPHFLPFFFSSFSSFSSFSFSPPSPLLQRQVPPTEAELRAKYLENIPKLVETQAKLAQYILSVGGAPTPVAPALADGDDAEAPAQTASPEQPAELLPLLTIATGTISFDAAAAASLGPEVNIRAVSALWSIHWPESAKLFLSRHQLKHLAAALQNPQSLLAVSVPVTVSKAVTAEGAAAEGASLNACGLVDISPLAGQGVLQAQLMTELAGQGFAAEAAPVPAPAEWEEEAAPAAPAGPACSISVSLSRALLTPRPSLAPTAVAGKEKLFATQSQPQPQSQPRPVGELADVFADLRSEISSVIKAIALEYVKMYPNGIAAGGKGSTAAAEGSAGAGDVLSLADRKAEFLYYLSTNGAYHTFKESLKPRIQRVVRHLYGPRGQALGRSAVARTFNTAGDAENKDGEDVPVLDQVLAELYVVLVKESNVVMNGMFAATVIAKDTLEVEGGGSSSAADDETETLVQKYQRLLFLADDAESDGRMEASEAWHLERILLARSSPALSAPAVLQHGYDSLARYYLRSAAAVRVCEVGGEASASTGLVVKAREALELAVAADNSSAQWRTCLVLGALLAEQGQERGLNLLLGVLQTLAAPQLPSFDDFDGYDSDTLCGGPTDIPYVDPLYYAIMAAVFSKAGLLVRARKALRLANKCFLLGQHVPSAATHGSPKRTLVLLLAKASLFLSEHCLVSLAESCYVLAGECEAAVTAKANAKNLPAATPPFIRCLMKRALARLMAMGCLDLGIGVLSSVEVAQEAVLVAVDPLNVIEAQLAVAAAASASDLRGSTALDALLAALTVANETQQAAAIPPASYIQTTKLLLAAQRVAEAYTVAVMGCRTRSTPSMLLQLGVCCLRQDRPQDCEDALQEANLLDNRNASVWAYLTLLCLSTGELLILLSTQQLIPPLFFIVSIFSSLTKADLSPQNI